MKKNGYTSLELLVVIIVLGIFTMGLIFSTSYAYKDESSENFSQIVHLIEKQAKLYGETLSNLKSENNMVITLNDLVTQGYYVADDNEGNVVDPRNSKNTLNGIKIKLTYKDGKVEAKAILEE